MSKFIRNNKTYDLNQCSKQDLIDHLSNLFDLSISHGTLEDSQNKLFRIAEVHDEESLKQELINFCIENVNTNFTNYGCYLPTNISDQLRRIVTDYIEYKKL